MTDCYVLKQAGGVMLPANDETADYLTSVKTDSYLKVKITRVRNYKFLQKVMVFFTFCFDHWNAEANYQYMDERAQKEEFRNSMTVMAGYHIETWDPFTGELKLKAMSLAFEHMDEDTFRECYSALIQVAMRKVFRGSDTHIYNKLVGFF